MSEGEEHTPVQQVFYRLFRIIGDLLPQHGLSWGEEGSRNILVRHICREGPSGAQGTLCSIILDPRNGIVIKIQRTQFGVDDRELKIKPAWDRELERSRLYVQYPDGEGVLSSTMTTWRKSLDTYWELYRSGLTCIAGRVVYSQVIRQESV